MIRQDKPRQKTSSRPPPPTSCLVVVLSCSCLVLWLSRRQDKTRQQTHNKDTQQDKTTFAFRGYRTHWNYVCFSETKRMTSLHNTTPQRGFFFFSPFLPLHVHLLPSRTCFPSFSRALSPPRTQLIVTEIT